MPERQREGAEGPSTTSARGPEASRVAEFSRFVASRHEVDVSSYERLWHWSVDDLENFWQDIWSFFGLPDLPAGTRAVGPGAMPGVSWFAGAKVNFTAEVFRHSLPEAIAVIDADESSSSTEITWADLEHRVASAAATFAQLGVGPGTSVVGYLPNRSEAVIAFLAAASLGATWAVCGLDYAPAAAIARLQQLEPAVLVAATGYWHAGRMVDSASRVRDVAAGLSGLTAIFVIGDATAIPAARPWEEAIAVADARLAPTPVPFDHPLWTLFSSGTTGRPKGIVHSHGGIVLEHLKYNGLQLDLGAGDRMLWYTSPSWMMWNALVCSLLVKSTIVCFDGSPGYPRIDALWAHAATLRTTVLGTSPAYVGACLRAGVDLAEHDLRALRTVGVTGSTFSVEAFEWLAAQLPGSVQIGSVSGGTDVATAFAGPSPTLPTQPGELSGPMLGVALEAFDEEGKPVRGKVGELVVTKPMPSMPIRFLNDPDFQTYRASYFDTFPDVWRHGDWITVTERGSIVIHGRSDATLNRRGVRIGSSDIYAVVETIPLVTDCLVIGLEEPADGYWMPLFVTLADGVALDKAIADTIRHAIATQASPRHVPDEIILAPGIPHTRTGKRLEVPVKQILRGYAASDVADPNSIDSPELLDWFAEVAKSRRATLKKARSARE